MAQAIMEPEKVRQFAEELQRFNSELENRMVLLHARFAALGDTWQDQEHEKFAEEFKQTMKALKKFVELSREHAPFLMRKAQRIEEYLNQR
ncbi:MAG: WXG100 family type VII secretion target [Verrucomicrobiae bacterium]|nr:WXG100 family type VII secretion target [Verrucomicrobiae bacterium]